MGKEGRSRRKRKKILTEEFAYMKLHTLSAGRQCPGDRE